MGCCEVGVGFVNDIAKSESESVAAEFVFVDLSREPDGVCESSRDVRVMDAAALSRSVWSVSVPRVAPFPERPLRYIKETEVCSCLP